MVIGANLPDVDVLAYFGGPGADLAWRRGWTHGVLALLVLPWLLAGGLLVLHRLRRQRGQWSRSTMVPRELILLSYVAIISHPFLDTLNTYGVRWLMPFSAEWFYGDTLFIIDPWVWLALALGLYLSSGRPKAQQTRTSNPAAVSLGVVGLYVAAMALSGWEARRIVAGELGLGSVSPVHDAMAGPVPFNPLTREFVVEQGPRYRVGTFRWLQRPHVDLGQVRSYPRDWPSHPAVQEAVETSLGRRFMGWARYPTFDIEQLARNRFLVHIVDLRYARGPGAAFGSVSVPVTLPDTPH